MVGRLFGAGTDSRDPWLKVCPDWLWVHSRMLTGAPGEWNLVGTGGWGGNPRVTSWGWGALERLGDSRLPNELVIGPLMS